MEFDILEILRQTFMVSGYVLFMMLILEFINVKTRGAWSAPLKKSGWLQILVSVVLGMTPGCVGVFTVVSLFTHGIVRFPALLAATLASYGDEAFIYISMDAGGAVKLMLILAGIGLFSGLVFLLFYRKKPAPVLPEHFVTHEHDHCCGPSKIEEIGMQIRRMSLSRSLMLSIILLVVFSQFVESGAHEVAGGHEQHEHAGHDHGLLSVEMLIFFFISLVSAVIVATVPEHFLTEHLWGHVIKKHFLRLFLWTLGALVGIALLMHYVDLDHWLTVNSIWLLVIATLVGLIPVSGPHIVFISLFVAGTIPFSVLLANSMVQDGHGGIPLLAEDKKSFVSARLIKLVMALAVGFVGYYTGW
jgi:hypothetical protein